jgi:hypothetical protein
MIPTTIAVAWESLIERRSAGGMKSGDSTMRYLLQPLVAAPITWGLSIYLRISAQISG